ncbi:MAG: sensor histidine kinase [Lachnospiraceae bacterium]|nr:sensor histidine kinase [Lachnospiraceae bacterium]
MPSMGNLLENARKYSKPNTEIVLTAEQSENGVCICLSNETEEVNVNKDTKEISQNKHKKMYKK